MAQYLRWVGRPNVLDMTDSLPLYYKRSLQVPRTLSERAIDAWELITISGFERWASKQASAVVVCSTVDAEEMNRNCQGLKPSVIENGVDVGQFSPKQRVVCPEPRLIMTGTLWYFPNVDAVRFYYQDILPAIRRLLPIIFTNIIGSRPSAELTKLNGSMGIQVIPNVPRMEDCLYSNDIYLCPLRVASGLRNKLLEAMAAGMAIVTTRLGAEGINVQAEEHVLFAETPDEFASQVQRLVNDELFRQRLGENARKYVIKHHSHTALGEKLESLYVRLLNSQNIHSQGAFQ